MISDVERYRPRRPEHARPLAERIVRADEDGAVTRSPERWEGMRDDRPAREQGGHDA